MSATHFHIPNALDRLFFVFDRAAARLSLPGAFIHMHLEMAGQVDVEGLKRALACLHRVYPVTAGKLEWSNHLSSPRWRLYARKTDAGQPVFVHHLSPPTEAELDRQIDRLLAQRIDPVKLAPFQFHVMRGLPAGDLVVIRWPHALMDARGGFLIMETIDRLYREAPDPGGLMTAGDERFDGLSELIQRAAEAHRPTPGPERQSAGPEQELQLPICPDFRELGPLRGIVRKLDESGCQRAQEIVKRTCAPARFGAYLRACAVRALHRLIGRRAAAGLGYSVPYVFEGRQPPYRSPVCRNIFTAERLFVPVGMALDRPAVARMLHEGTSRLVAAGPDARRLKRSLMITSLPAALLGHLVRHALIYPPEPWQRDEFGRPPSLPLGFMQAFGMEKRSFCGAELRYVHAFRPPLPRQGIGIQVMGEQGRLAVCGLCYEVRWEMMNRFLDDFIEAILSPE